MWHALVEDFIDEVVVLLRQWPFPIIVLLGQIQTNDVPTVLGEEPGEVLLSADSSLIYQLVNYDIRLRCE